MANMYMNTNEAMDYLNVSRWKLERLIDGSVITPIKKISSNRQHYNLYLILELIKAKRQLKEEGYVYKYN